LAASLIAQQFALAADPAVTRVFLLTQNNWDAGSSPIITSKYKWRTPLGSLEPDTYAVRSLVKTGLVQVEESIFDKEHGITGVIPYIAFAFPNAVVVPLVIRDDTSDEAIDLLVEHLNELKNANTVIVGTIDMSHYLPKPIADAHDRHTRETIESLAYSSLSRLDIDTAPTLRAILKLAELDGEEAFVKTGAANSADIVGDNTLTSTTGYITGYFEKGIRKTEMPVHALFVGDVMLDRNVAERASAEGSHTLLSAVERLFLGSDINVLNLEGTITTEPSPARVDHNVLRFTFEPDMVKNIFSSLNLDVVSLANNHALDFGSEGYEQTRSYLKDWSISTFGHPLNKKEFLSSQIQVRGKLFCFVGYMQLFTPVVEKVLQEINIMRNKCEKVVVFAHWGEEYVPYATASQREVGQSFIDAGADVVVGAHPHVVQPVELYNGKPIFYSLGNFVFDQNFSWETMHGIALHVEFADSYTRFTFMPVSIHDGVVSVADYADSQRVLARLVDTRLSPNVAHEILTSSSFILNHASTSHRD